jgi:hypothetical protein
MAMKSAILPVLLCVLLAPVLAVAADGAGEGVTRRSLDLSLPRDALTENWSPPSAGYATQLPDLDSLRMDNSDPARRGGGRRGDLRQGDLPYGDLPYGDLPYGDLPYGAGYEARQSGGGGHGRGGGRGR